MKLFACILQPQGTIINIKIIVYFYTERLPRQCTQSVVVGKFEFHEEDLIIIPVHLLHHNTQVWGDPGVFRPER